MPTDLQPEPPADCRLCPRLVSLRHENALAEPSWFNGAVPSFGIPKKTKLLIVGLAPGLKGANRTGRAFTGDQSGDLLYSTLREFGFARGSYGGHVGDGLELVDTMITNAVRCVPPANKPTAAEINTCRPFLADRLRTIGRLRAVVALGRVAHESTLTAFALRKADHRFAHGARHEIDDGLSLFDSYHCSRYNVNTGRLTAAMFHDVFRAVRDAIG